MATHLEVDRSAVTGGAHARNLPPTFELEESPAHIQEQPHELEVIYPDVERYTLSMSFISFLFVAAGAAMYQSGANGAREGVDSYFVVGLLAIAAAVGTTIVMRRRIRARLLDLHRKRGLSGAQARALAEESLRNLDGTSARHERW